MIFLCLLPVLVLRLRIWITAAMSKPRPALYLSTSLVIGRSELIFFPEVATLLFHSETRQLDLDGVSIYTIIIMRPLLPKDKIGLFPSFHVHSFRDIPMPCQALRTPIVKGSFGSLDSSSRSLCSFVSIPL